MTINSKFLPIGTICNIKSTDKKIMISGYFPIEYFNGLKKYDYIGFAYPLGTTDSTIYKFDHTEIIEVLFLGYDDGDGLKKISNYFNSIKINFVEQPTINKKISSEGYEFDENGVVLSIPNNEKITKEELSFNDYGFDKNGIVISNSLTEKEQLEMNKTLISNGFEFDENGVVISVTGKKDENKKVVSSEYEFDENGYVIKNNVDIEQNPFGKVSNDYEAEPINDSKDWPIFDYKFNSNGVVVEEVKKDTEIKENVIVIPG